MPEEGIFQENVYAKKSVSVLEHSPYTEGISEKETHRVPNSTPRKSIPAVPFKALVGRTREPNWTMERWRKDNSGTAVVAVNERIKEMKSKYYGLEYGLAGLSQIELSGRPIPIDDQGLADAQNQKIVEMLLEIHRIGRLMTQIPMASLRRHGVTRRRL